MKNFLAVFTGSPQGMDQWNALDATARAQREREGIAAWHQWVEDHSDAIVDNGGPLGKTKRVTSAGIADFRNALSAYTVVRAESPEAAAALFANHPHFTIFPGDGVEVMEVLPMPDR
jgi:hypothetical protein